MDFSKNPKQEILCKSARGSGCDPADRQTEIRH